MDIEGKIWGKTSLIFNQNNVEIHRVEGRQGGYSSVHVHEHKHNMFFLEKGMVKIKVMKNDYELVDSTILENTGETTVVKPGEYHQFIIIEDSVFWEIYYTMLESNDIKRKQVGGLVKRMSGDKGEESSFNSVP